VAPGPDHLAEAPPANVKRQRVSPAARARRPGHAMIERTYTVPAVATACTCGPTCSGRRAGALPGDPELRPLREGASRFRRRYADQWADHDRGHPTSPAGRATSTRTGGRRPESGCRTATPASGCGLAGRAGRRACSNPFPPGDPGPVRVHRVGGGAVRGAPGRWVNGISYYAMNQWHVAALRPPHLAAMCIWEGAADLPGRHPPRRDPSSFWSNWYGKQSPWSSTGVGSAGRAARSRGTRCGPETLTDAELAAARVPFGEQIRSPTPGRRVPPEPGRRTGGISRPVP
jgi:hypothetical protein